jgi:hypothetical protein
LTDYEYIFWVFEIVGFHAATGEIKSNTERIIIPIPITFCISINTSDRLVMSIPYRNLAGIPMNTLEDL